MIVSEIFEKLDFLDTNYRVYCSNFLSKYYSVNSGLTFDQIIVRLQKNEPIEYILNLAEFCNYTFYVDKNCLIPRHETEEIVKKAFEFVITNHKSSLTVFDIGTGSGCIVISLVKILIEKKIDLNNIKFIAIDISDKALEISKKNAEEAGLEKYIKFYLSDFSEFDFGKHLSNQNLFLANLPYIPENRLLPKSVIDYEPKLALFGGENGDELNKLLIKKLRMLNGAKHLIMEEDEGEIVNILF